MDLDVWGDQPSGSYRSYAAARVGPYYGSVRGVPDEASTVGFNADLLLGAVFNRRFLAELRYDWTSQVAGTAFDGLTFQIGFFPNP
jgi:hypothetical protein